MELAYRIDLRDALYKHGYYKVAKYFEDENYLLFYRSKVEKKLYSILKTIIDKNSFNHLRETNKKIKKTRNRFISIGWFASETSIANLEEEDRVHSLYPITNAIRLYYLKREEKGYHVIDENSDISIVKIIRAHEEDFFSKHKRELEELHQIYSTKEGIMAGNYTLVDSDKKELADLICAFLGYRKLNIDNGQQIKLS